MMGVGERRVDISFDRERRVFRAFADVVGRVTRRPVPVATANDSRGVGSPASPRPQGPAKEPVETVAPAQTGATELERFAAELQERAQQQLRDRGERRSSDRHGTARSKVPSVVLPEATVAPPRRRASDRMGVGWQGAPRGASFEQPAATVAATATMAATGAAPAAAIAAHPAEANARAARYLGALVSAYGPLDPSDAAIDLPLVDVVVLDASALAALARGNARARAHLSQAVGALARIVIPATALVDAAHARVAHAIADVTPIDTSLARAAARLIADTGTNAPSTALAMALAARDGRSAILTADVASAHAFARAIERAKRPYVLAV